MDYAVSFGFLISNPLKKLSRPKGQPRKGFWMTKEQIEKFLSKLTGIYHDLGEFMIWTGARIGESLLFNKKSLLKSNTILKLLIEKTKKSEGTKYRYLKIDSLGSRFESLLKRLNLHPITGYYFSNSEGNPVNMRQVQKEFKKAFKAAGLKNFVGHDMRGTFAMHRAIVITNFYELMREIGHKSPVSLQAYIDEAGTLEKSDSIFYDVLGKLTVVGGKGSSLGSSAGMSSKNKLSTGELSQKQTQ